MLQQTPSCDGELQPGEGTVDGPFDKDGDGFFDGANLDCQYSYAEEDLDCNDLESGVAPGFLEVLCNGLDDDCDENTVDSYDDDGDGYSHCEDCQDQIAEVFPGNPEICGDDLDNDCNDKIDDGCVYDYSGTWNLDQTVSYQCAMNSVSFSFNSFLVLDNNPLVAVSSMGSSQPGTMTGTIIGDEDFYATRTITGTCDETYTVSGTFTSEESFEGVFTADFSGGMCLNCSQQSWGIEGVRQASE
jgi:hypothetical protein